MKKVRQIIGAVILMAMLCSALPNNVFAYTPTYAPTPNLEIVDMGPETTVSGRIIKKYETGTGWDVWYVLNADNLTAWDNVNEGFHITTADSHSGNAAVVMNYTNATQGNRFIQLYTDKFSELTAGQQYRLSLWYKGETIGTNNPKVTLYGTTNDTWNPITTTWTKVAGENGWNQYYIDVDGDASTQLRIEFSCQNSVLMDDIAIQPIKSGSGSEAVLGDNVLTNGGFENYILGRKATGETDYSEVFTDEDLVLTTWELKNVNVEGQTLKAVSGAGRTGNNALYMRRTAAMNGKDSMPGLFQNMTLGEGTYTLSYWIRGYKNTTDGDMIYNTYPPAWVNLLSKTWVDWTKVEQTFVVDAGESKTINDAWIKLKRAGAFLVDDFELYKNGDTSTNYIKNGSFEDVVAVSGPKNPVLYPVKAGGAATLTWTNPTLDASSITVTVNGEAYACSPVLTKNSFNEIMISGLTNNQEATVVLTAVIAGETFTETMTVTPYAGTGIEKIGSWSIGGSEITSGDTTYYANYGAYIDDTEKDGDPCLRFDANINKKVGSLNVGITQTATGLRTDKLYRLKFDAKMDGMYNFVISRTPLGSMSTYFKNFPTLTSSSGDSVKIHDEGTKRSLDWDTYTLDIVSGDDDEGLYDSMCENIIGYDMNIRLCFEKLMGSLWLDNIELYEISEEGVIIGNNLLKNSGFSFEDGYSIETGFTMLDGSDEVAVGYIPASGDVTCKAYVKKFTEGSDLDVTLFAALYDGDELEEVCILERTVPGKPILVPADELTATITVPDLASGDYKVKLFVWDGIDGIHPLCDNGEISETIIN